MGRRRRWSTDVQAGSSRGFAEFFFHQFVQPCFVLRSECLEVVGMSGVELRTLPVARCFWHGCFDLWVCIFGPVDLLPEILIAVEHHVLRGRPPRSDVVRAVGM